jgi:hypothetical protein
MSIVAFPKKSTARARARGDSITGRDGYIVAKALAYAIETIAALPEQYQEWGDREDMKAIMAVMFSRDLGDLATESACRHLFHPGSALVRNTDIDLVGDDPDAA